jgi:hypothetical protein
VAGEECFGIIDQFVGEVGEQCGFVGDAAVVVELDLIATRQGDPGMHESLVGGLVVDDEVHDRFGQPGRFG